MPRYFAPITVESLRDKISDMSGGKHRLDIRTIINKLLDDFKIDFDCENFEAQPQGREGEGAADFLGYHALPSGLTFLGCYAGGDWEMPVCFCLYWSGSAIRGYVPTDGNCFNKETKKAWGNAEDEDEHDWHEVDFAKMLADLQARILPKPAKTNNEPTPAQDGLDSVFYEIGQLVASDARHRDGFTLQSVGPEQPARHALKEIIEYLEAKEELRSSTTPAEAAAATDNAKVEIGDAISCMLHQAIMHELTAKDLAKLMRDKLHERFPEHYA